MIGALSLLAGVLLGLLSATIPGRAWQYTAAGLLVLWVLSSWRHPVRGRACAMLLAGQLLAWAQADHWLERRLPVPGADARVLAEGLIAGVPSRDGATLHFDLRADSLAGATGPQARRLLRVSWRDPHAAPRVGERWRLLLRLTPLEETRNFAGMDSARLAFRDGVHGAGRVLPGSLNELLELAPASLDTVRARIAMRVRETIADPDAAALVTALAVGLTDGMSRDQWRVFNATGTTHLVAISGMHVTLFAWLAFRLARLAWRRLPGAALLDREPFALLLGLAAAGGYALLAGFSVPTQRTWLMLALYVSARLAARCVQPGRLWAVALALVLLLDPRAPLAAGFWLSFIAVGVLLMFAGNEAGEGMRLRAWSAARLQFAVMLALTPASLAIFGGVSLLGLVVNLVAIPLLSLVFVPIVLAGAIAAWLAPSLATPCFALAAQLHEWLWPGLVWCANLDGEWLSARWTVAAPGWWYALALPATLVCLGRWPWTLRLGAVCALLPLCFATSRAPQAGVKVSVLDAGRGSAVLLQTRNHALLFDTGDAWNTHGARLARIVLPALDADQRRTVDLLVLPTLSGDRAQAAALLAFERELGGVNVPGGWPGSGLPVNRCRDARWRWDGVDFRLYAIQRYCLLRVSVAGHSLLMSGDLDAGAERLLLARLAPGELASDVVLPGRQGSGLASSPQWIENTAPGLVIATGGIEAAQSRARVLARWRERAPVLDTRRDGGIELRLGAGGIEFKTVASARYPFHWRRSSADAV